MDANGRREVIRQKSFAVPSVNPFIHELKLNLRQKIQICFMSVTVAPIRFVLIFLLLVLAWVLGYLSTIGMNKDSKKPTSKWRNMVCQIVSVIGRIQFFVMGFLWIKVKGSRASGDEARILVAAPHSSFFDALLWFSTFPLPSPVSRSENAEAAIFGTLLKTMQPVLVSRHDPRSRQKTIKQIHHRATTKDNWPQIIIFPEGTCTNRKALITFKAGAFIPGTPVQPVLLKYPNYLDAITWTMSGPGAFQLLWITLCQFYSNFEIEFLPVYYPNEEEISNPKKYANNVRHKMAQALGISCTDHTFDDCRLMYHAKSKNLPLEAGLVEFSKLSKKLGIDIDDMRELLDEFSSISRTCEDGLMGIEEFGRHLNLPITDELKELFHLYDRNGSGYLDFREYVIGMSLVSQAAVTEKTVKLAFKVFDRDGDGLVSLDELDHVLKSVFGPDFEASCIYDKIDKEKKGKVDYDQFYSFVKKRPEYARLFISYTDLEQDQIPDELRCTLKQRNSGAELSENSCSSSGIIQTQNNSPREKSD